MWYFKKDRSKPTITSLEHIRSGHRHPSDLNLPKTAVLLYMSGLEYIKEKYEVEFISEQFPRFLNECPIYKIKGDNEICFLDGGRGAPQAVDTLETLKALQVENVISVGMIGGFSKIIKPGDIVIPSRAYSEEGTSLHYYKEIEYSEPNKELLDRLIDFIPTDKILPVISTDAVYRQTLYKETLWRNKGCVGVDMETSALLSVGKYLNINVASVLMVSDIHPIDAYEVQEWKWYMTKEMRKEVIYQVIDFSLTL